MQTQRKCFYKRENTECIANTLSEDVTSSYFGEKYSDPSMARVNYVQLT